MGDHNDFVSRPIPKLLGWILCLIMILIGNLSWIITEESCKNDNGWKIFPGLMFYDLFTFYGYSLVSVYIIFLNNDLQRKICYFQTLHGISLNQCFIWFHWLFPSITISNDNAKSSAEEVEPQSPEETENEVQVPATPISPLDIDYNNNDHKTAD